jgi:MYXO-CTERM domain-containing protein
MMNSVSRLQKYSALAAAPCASLGAGALGAGALGALAVGGISVEATADGITTVTASSSGTSWSNQAVFSAGGIDFNVFANWYNSSSSNSASMGLSIDNRDDAGPMQFWSGGTQSKVISASATGAGHTNSGYGGSRWSAFGASSGNYYFNELGTGETGSDRYLGFFVQNELTSDYVAGWINFDFERALGIRSFTINAWGFNVGDSDTYITMPANGGAAPVPGIGGLAALAMGAAGVRRKRQRVA